MRENMRDTQSSTRVDATDSLTKVVLPPQAHQQLLSPDRVWRQTEQKFLILVHNDVMSLLTRYIYIYIYIYTNDNSNQTYT